MSNKILILLFAAASGCASYRPVVDTQGVDMNAYHADLRDCQQFVAELQPGARAVAGALAGAAFGALLGAAFGNHRAASAGASIGAVQGGATGAGSGAAQQIDVVKRCMAGRGYRVLA